MQTRPLFRNVVWSVLVVLAVVTGLVSGAVPAAAHDVVLQDALGTAAPLPDTALKDLVPTSATHVCKGLYAVLDPSGDVLGCTHGEDVEQETAPGSTTSGNSTTATSVPCQGNGNNGMRVQALYAYQAGKANRVRLVARTLRNVMAQMDAAVDANARPAGAPRRVRWLTTRKCAITLTPVAVSADAMKSFPTFVTELRAKGFSNPRRKYLVWNDARVMCGIAAASTDDRATAGNAANGHASRTYFARVDNHCWTPWVGAHELFHMLGAVARSAPNSNGHWHCTDASDVMCYSEHGIKTRNRCKAMPTFRLDCGRDDYFNPKPRSGSYLATRWNTADSAFLAGGRYANWRDPAPTTFTATADDRQATITWKTPAGRYAAGVEIYRDGTRVTTTRPEAGSWVDTKVTNGRTYRYHVQVLDQLGYRSKASASQTVEPQHPVVRSLLG